MTGRQKMERVALSRSLLRSIRLAGEAEFNTLATGDEL
jgi:hypothetical protein